MPRRCPLSVSFLVISLCVGCVAGLPVDEDAGSRPLDLGVPAVMMDRGMGPVVDMDMGVFCNPVAETCNGLDDDCDGVIDNGFNIGSECTVTLDECAAVGEIQCNPVNNRVTVCFVETEPEPQPEECNGRDDDCDGDVDEGFVENCGECVPMPEACNQADDDCDGRIDEELGNAPAPPEVCNGRDDDCDSQIDEGNACPCRQRTFQNKTYLLCGEDVPGNPNAFDERLPWTEAKARCEGLGFNLISIGSAEEDRFLFESLSAEGFEDTWLGLNDRSNEGTFVWNDGEVLTYSNWDGGEPNNGSSGGEDCGIMLMSRGRASRWDDRPCGRSYHYVCEPQ